MKTLIYNATIINENKKFRGSVLIDNEEIVDIFTDNDALPDDAHVIDATDLLLLPGVIDDQVHFRDPGLTHKADIYTESMAAVAGGVTSYMEMPNTIPQTTTIELLEEKFTKAGEKSLANFSFYIGATNDNLNEVLKADPRKVCGIKCFMGSSTGNMLVEGKPLEALFEKAHMLVATHCEEESIIKKNSSDYLARYGEDLPVKYHPQIRSAEACYQSSSKAVRLSKKYGTRLHVLHLTTAREMELFEKGAPDEKNITAEVCVHHLWFDDRDYEKKGSKIKWNPAVKTSADKEVLRKSLKSDIIDVVATDHAPHTLEEKENTYFKCPSGGPLVQHSLPVMLEMVSQGVFTYEQVVTKMCHAPAQLFKVENRGFIRKGYKADLVIVSPRDAWKVQHDNIVYKCNWSPFEGTTFNHKVEYTFVNGHLAYSKGVFDEGKKGQRLTFSR
jgi:dihydroorotase